MKVLQILILSVGLFAVANGQKAVLSGTVTDKFGSLIPNANVEVKNLKGEIISSRTNVEGRYQLELVEGEYNIEITSQFDKFSISNYWVIHKMQLDVALQCKTCEVVDENLLKMEPEQTIQIKESKISGKILQRPLEELPKEQNNIKRKNKNNKQ